MIVIVLSGVNANGQQGNSLDGYAEIAGASGTFLPLIATDSGSDWVVVKIVTDRFSGSAAAAPGAPAVISGRYNVLQYLGLSSSVSGGLYCWSRPTGLSFNTGTLTNDPSASGWFQSQLFSCRLDDGLSQSATRYIICRLNSRASGSGVFSDVHLVPDGWQGNVRSAVLFICKRQTLPTFSAVEQSPHIVVMRSFFYVKNGRTGCSLERFDL